MRIKEKMIKVKNKACDFITNNCAEIFCGMTVVGVVGLGTFIGYLKGYQDGVSAWSFGVDYVDSGKRGDLLDENGEIDRYLLDSIIEALRPTTHNIQD